MSASAPDLAATALVIVDLQRGFEDLAYWGRRDNPAAEANVARLVAAWHRRGGPRVHVRHDSVTPGSPLAPGQPGNDLHPDLGAADLLVTKRVNSAFYGEPDLHAWLGGRGLRALALCGATTNHCVETTARMAGNLGYQVWFVIDAMFTFDRVGPDGATVAAEELTRATAASLHGEFASVVTTDALLGR